MIKFVKALILALVLQFAVAAAQPAEAPAGNIAISVSPQEMYMKPNATMQYMAAVSGLAKYKIRWTATGGTVSSTGLFTAGYTPGTAKVTAAIVGRPRKLAASTIHMVVSPTRYGARTDLNTQQLPDPMPTWGGAMGLGNTWTDPRFNQALYIRASDASVNVSTSLLTADGGAPQLIAVDNRHYVLTGPGGRKFLMAFDPVTHAVSATPMIFTYSSVQFSDTDPQRLWALDDTKIREIIVKPDWTGVAADNVLFDFASDGCLGASFKMTWNGIFQIAMGNNVFKSAFSDEGGQGTGHYAAAWDRATGCWVVDTLTGTVWGVKGAIGTIDDGAGNALVDRFYLHEAGGGKHPKYSAVGMTLRTKDGAPGCIAGNCAADSPYIWEIGTTHLRPCGPYRCSGHAAQTYVSRDTGDHYRKHFYSDPSVPQTNLIDFPDTFPDQHGSANNVNPDYEDDRPVFLVSTDVNPLAPWPTYQVWGYDEILAIPSDGSKIPWRFGQTLNTGFSRYFICQNAVGVVSQDGNWLLFTSDMGGGGVLGKEKDGTTDRCDTFLLQLK